MSKFSGVSIMVVDRNTLMASNCGFACNAKVALKMMFPGSVIFYDSPEIIDLLEKCENLSGSIFIMDPYVGEPVLAHWDLQGLVTEYNSYKTSCNDL